MFVQKKKSQNTKFHIRKESAILSRNKQTRTFPSTFPFAMIPSAGKKSGDTPPNQFANKRANKRARQSAVDPAVVLAVEPVQKLKEPKKPKEDSVMKITDACVRLMPGDPPCKQKEPEKPKEDSVMKITDACVRLMPGDPPCNGGIAGGGAGKSRSYAYCERFTRNEFVPSPDPVCAICNDEFMVDGRWSLCWKDGVGKRRHEVMRRAPLMHDYRPVIE